MILFFLSAAVSAEPSGACHDEAVSASRPGIYWTVAVDIDGDGAAEQWAEIRPVLLDETESDPHAEAETFHWTIGEYLDPWAHLGEVSILTHHEENHLYWIVLGQCAIDTGDPELIRRLSWFWRACQVAPADCSDMGAWFP